MSIIIASASVIITAALVFYTLGVFGERRRTVLQGRHVVLFWVGLCCDTTGTLLMSMFARTGGSGEAGLHAATGMLAIGLMVIHAVWATAVFFRGSAAARAAFSRFSIVVWLVWLIPYICGMLVGMPMAHFDGPIALAIAIGLVIVIAAALGGYDRSKGSTVRHA